MNVPLLGNSLETLFIMKDCRRKRLSSYSRTGGNDDWFTIPAGTVKTFAEMDDCAIIRHIWCTVGSPSEYFARKIVLRMFWDGEEHPSVEAPLGDFFGIGHGIVKNFTSGPLMMSPQDGKGFNCFFPMPFRKLARFELANETEADVNFYFYIDYETYQSLGEDVAYFHACWNREKDTNGWAKGKPGLLEEKTTDSHFPAWYPKAWEKCNLDGADNYVILEAQGKGQYVGCNLNIDCFEKQANDWYGEGDDMIFIDGDPAGTLYGTGTEDYFNTAFGPAQEYCTPCHGITVYSGTEQAKWSGKNSMYRFHIADPIHFSKSIRVTIEHGHANKLANDYSSTAYWYQSEPHKVFPLLPAMIDRLPR